MTLNELQHYLTEALQAQEVKTIDDSEKHKGHAGYKPGGGTHLRIGIVSTAFEGKSRLQCHQMVMNLLQDELKSGLHAVQLILKTPGEIPG